MDFAFAMHLVAEGGPRALIEQAIAKLANVRVHIWYCLQSDDCGQKRRDEGDQDDTLHHVGNRAQIAILREHWDGSYRREEGEHGEDLGWRASKCAINKGNRVEGRDKEHSPEKATAAAERCRLSNDRLRAEKTALHRQLNQLALLVG